MWRCAGLLVSVLVFAACGGDEGAKADAALPIDAGAVDSTVVDAAPDSGIGCSKGASIAPANQDFGAIGVGTTTSASFTVRNDCTRPSGVLSAAITGAPSFAITANTCTGSLPAQGTCVVTVRFSPTSVGAASATLSVAATPGSTVQAMLNGTGVPVEGASISPSAADFGAVCVTESPERSFTVTNLGGAATGALTASISGADASRFSITASTCSAPLAPAASCTLTVKFSPLGPGARAAVLSVTGTPGGSATASLTGTGLTCGGLVLTPASHDFGSVAAGQMSGPVTYTLTNAAGVATGTITTALSGTDGASYVVGSNTCAGPLNPGSSCTLTVTFAPASAGTKAASLTVSTTPGGIAMATLVGTATP